jgi:hypothetical protein
MLAEDGAGGICGMATCEKCGHEAEAACEVVLGRQANGARAVWCVPCWNAEAQAQSQAHAEALANRPRCEACGKRAATWDVGIDRVGMCGPCKNRARRAAERSVAAGGAVSILGAMFGDWTPRRAELIGFARSGR